MSTPTIPAEATGTQYREMEIRAVDTEKREITGVLVPYNETIDVAGYRERFEKGAFGSDVDGPLFYGHDHRNGGLPIGKVIEGRDTDEGFEITAKISDTPKGNEVYALLRDGVIKTFSAGFNPVESRMDEDVLVRTAAQFLEASVTPFAAYKTAKIAEVREENKKESDVDTNDTKVVDELRDTVTELERKIAAMAEVSTPANEGSQFRTAGEVLKALATGDDKARAEFRAFADSSDADVTRKAWLQRPYKFVTEKRRLVNVLSKAPLPSNGLSVEYPKVSNTTGTVEKQSAEGAALAYMEVSLGTGTATVGTYGGYSSISRQAIERSDVNYLNAVFMYQAEQYAKATNADVATAVAGVTGQSVAFTGSLAAKTPADWLGWIVDAAAAVETNSLGLGGDFMIASTDVFKQLITLTDANDRPVFAVNRDGSNTIGNASLTSLSANVGGVPVVWVPGLAVRTAALMSAEAVTVLESPGAPFRLQDESIINLTKDFSLYGYLATTINDTNGVARATGLTA